MLPLIAQAVSVHAGSGRWDGITGFPWFAWIAIIAIVCGTLSGIIQSLIKHRERIAMIQMGMHPDLPADARSRVDAKPDSYGMSEL